jgi:hypothetical protein
MENRARRLRTASQLTKWPIGNRKPAVPLIPVGTEIHSYVERCVDADAMHPIQDHQAAKQTTPSPHGRKNASTAIGAKPEPPLRNQFAGQRFPAVHRVKTFQHRLETCLAAHHSPDVRCPAAAMGDKPRK